MLWAPGARAASVAGWLCKAVLTGSTYGGVAGAGEGEAAADTGKGALTGAATGATLGTVGAGAVEALSPIATRVANVYRGIRDPGLEAERRVAASYMADLQRAGRSLSSTLVREATIAGLPLAVADVGERTRALARSAANPSPERRAP